MTDSREPQQADYKRRVTHTVSFKLDVCNYFINVPNATVTGAARFFNITRKQVRYFRKNVDSYRLLSNRRLKRNGIRADKIRTRAKYAEEEGRVFKWFMESRSEGKSIRLILSVYFSLCFFNLVRKLTKIKVILTL